MQDYKNKDFTDYFMLFLNNDSDFFSAFNKLVNDAKPIEVIEHVETVNKEFEEYMDIDFYDSLNKKYINQPISFSAIVRGEAPKPYIYPSKAKVTCGITKGDKCTGCGLFLTGGKLEISLESINPLELIDINNESKLRLIKNKTGIIQCGQFELELIGEKYMQELFLSPKIDTENKEQRFIVRHAFYEGSNIIPNKSYKFYGVPTTSPKNQSLVFYIKKAEEEENDLETFKLVDDLGLFQPEGLYIDDIQNKLDEIYADFNVNLSPAIKHRDDMLFAVDLVFHSVLNFWFGKSLEKGWAEALIVGDTSVGKTKIADKLLKHYRMGVIQGSENSTIAGLIGGMTRFESINIMTWGLLPLNNSRMVVMDEMSGIDKNVFSELTRIRSEGIAERTIVGSSSSTPAKVRLLWLSNPRKRSMKLYDSGCDMVKELVGNEEDISRFDFILAVSGDELSTEKMNLVNSNRPTHKYKSDLCNKLVLWAWSRKPKHVVFEPDVNRLILTYAIEMSKTYTSNFPLVLGATIRLKIARLSIALAARLFSTDDGENIIVTEHHVAYIYQWLNKIYSKQSLGYREYSNYFNASEKKSEDNKHDIMQDIETYCVDRRSFILNMLTNVRITALEIRDFSGYGKDQSDKLRTKLVGGGYLLKKAGFYVKSDLFRKILKEEMGERDDV